MAETYRSFDAHLSQIRNDELRKIARLWGVGPQGRKEENIEAIRRGLANPEHVREVVSRLEPYERAALSLLCEAGGAITTRSLGAGLRAAGVQLPKARNDYERGDTYLIRPLISAGLLLSGYQPDPTYLSEYSSGLLFSDSRLLAEAGPLAPQPLPLAPSAPPSETLIRRPSALALDVLSILAAVDSIGGLQLTRAGAVRVGDMRKLMKALKWSEESIVLDGLEMPHLAHALVGALRAAGLLAAQGQRDLLVAGEGVARFSELSYAEQATALMRGFLRLAEWREDRGLIRTDYEGDYHLAGRLALLVALKAVPADDPGRPFFAVEDFDTALFARVGEHFSLGYPPVRPYAYNQTPEQVRQAERRWRTALANHWAANVSPWIDAALTTWLYFLGLVELGFAGDDLTSFRLSDLGLSVLHPLVARERAPAAAAGPAWLVQPDFEVLAYLEHATPAQLAFLEQHAERREAQTHIARYRLTRDSVYGGLERGTDLGTLLETLRAGAGADIPQNVAASVREWAAQRERLTLYRRASLLEFPDVAARDAVLSRGIAGAPVGERFILLTNPDEERLPEHATIDYARPLPRCLKATEDGSITLARAANDLLIAQQLDRWGEPQPGGGWRLTAASVREASRGGSAAPLLALLRERLSHPVPPLLEVALRAWAGERLGVALAAVTVLRCPRPDMLQAIAGSPRFAPFVCATLGPDLLLVDPSRVEELRRELAWVGLDVAGEIG